MKFMNNHYGVSRIFCAPNPTDGGGDNTDNETGDDQGDEGEEPESDEDGEEPEKKYTEKDMEEAVKRRLARERRKWQRQQQRKPEDNLDSGEKAGKTGNAETEIERKAREAEEKASALELKWTCLEHDVRKDCVDDVLALARVHVNKDSSLDIEDAIDKVLEKYPQFKDSYEDDDQDEGDGKKKGWGQRHGKPPKKSATVDDEIRKQLFGN